MTDTMSIKEASEYLGLSEENIVLLIEAGELMGEQQKQAWRLTHASVVAYKARQIARNATQGFEGPDR
jgi:excisionase family DNA binding protein